MAKNSKKDLVSSIKTKIFIAVFFIQGFFLYSSEFFNTLNSTKLDMMGLGMVERLPLFFKPLVAVMFAISVAIQILISFRVLKPVFTFINDKNDYDRARTAIPKLAWRIFLFQLLFWTGGIILYSFIYREGTLGGFSTPLNILIKTSVGLIASTYTVVIINMILIPAKRLLNIQDIRKHETDFFGKIQYYIVNIASLYLVLVHVGYLSWYLSQTSLPFMEPLLSVILWSVFFSGISILLLYLARYEYRLQISEIENQIAEMLDSKDTITFGNIALLNFDTTGSLVFLFNRISTSFHRLINQIDSSVNVLSGSVQELSTTSKEVTGTSNMQAAAVKEVVSTMEDSNTITQSVGHSISEVSRIALRTRDHVESGTGIVQQTSTKMNEIRQKNTDTISGIRSLNQKIRDIWNIVDMINEIVEQTRIIAFNASLEASTAGEAGRNFRIVADEIKRLADSTSQSTSEIQERITEIQKAANRLIIVSEEGTERIRQGYELSEQLHDVFSDILTSADISVSSSESIDKSIRQQISAFEQILETMKEISLGIDNLVSTQSQTTRTAEELSGMAANLKSWASEISINLEENINEQ